MGVMGWFSLWSTRGSNKNWRFVLYSKKALKKSITGHKLSDELQDFSTPQLSPSSTQQDAAPPMILCNRAKWKSKTQCGELLIQTNWKDRNGFLSLRPSNRAAIEWRGFRPMSDWTQHCLSVCGWMDPEAWVSLTWPKVWIVFLFLQTTVCFCQSSAQQQECCVYVLTLTKLSSRSHLCGKSASLCIGGVSRSYH